MARTPKRKPPDRLLSILHAARTRAKKHRGPRGRYDLDVPAHLTELRRRFATKRCELTGLSFNMRAVKTRVWNSPSIDRIDATKGYTHDNVRFILWSLNAALADWGDTVLELVATAWLAANARRRHES